MSSTSSPPPTRRRPSVASMLLPILAIIIFAGVTMELVERSDSEKADTLAPGATPIEIGATLPDIDWTEFGGKTFKLAELKQKVVLVNFWASWCAACLTEMPSIVKVRDAYHAKGFEVIAVNMDETPSEHVDKFKKKFDMRFLIGIDPDQKLAALFDIHALPYTIVLGPDRKILHIEVGDRDWNAKDFRKTLEKWLSET